MASNWRGIVQVREQEDRRALWQRRSSRRIPTAHINESGSESGANTTTSSGGSRSSSTDDGDRLDDRLIVTPSRTVQQLSPLFNRIAINRLDSATAVGRSSSFREAVNAVPYTPVMGAYKRSTSPYNRNPPISSRGSSTTDHLTADYVPSWKPDRRFSTPAVPRYRGSFSRSPSPRFISKKGGQQQFEYFRNRAASLPASNASINAVASGGNKKRPPHNDHWPQTRSPSRVEQRFLKLSESADYDKIRTFVIGTKGELVERGFCYRHRSETASSSSPGSTGPAASPNEDTNIHDSMTVIRSSTIDSVEPMHARPIAKYSVLIIGSAAVGKSSLLSLWKQTQELQNEDMINGYSTDIDSNMATVLPVLICGEEVHLELQEFSVSDTNVWTQSQWQAAIVVYSIRDKRSFSAAADVLYQIRSNAGPASPIPIVLVANKIDLERQRQVHDQDGMELAKSYDCRFIDVSVELNHHVEDLLTTVMNEIWRCTVAEYRQRHMLSSNDIQKDSTDDTDSQYEKKPKRFSFRKQQKPKIQKDITTNGQPRSSRARSLYTLPDGLPISLANHSHTSGGFLSRLLGRRAAQSCEDLFSRLLRG